MVFQSYHLLDDLTVQENIDLRSPIRTFARSAAELGGRHPRSLQIVAKKDLYPSQLSGGQQQLVGIARAVIHKPSLLLATSPRESAFRQAKEIMELFRDLNQQGTTIVQVTHRKRTRLTEAARFNCGMDGWLAIQPILH